SSSFFRGTNWTVIPFCLASSNRGPKPPFPLPAPSATKSFATCRPAPKASRTPCRPITQSFSIIHFSFQCFDDPLHRFLQSLRLPLQIPMADQGFKAGAVPVIRRLGIFGHALGFGVPPPTDDLFFFFGQPTFGSVHRFRLGTGGDE